MKKHFSSLLTASWEKQKQHWSKNCWWSSINNLVIQKLKSRQIYSLHFVFHQEYSKFINHNSFWRKRTANLQLLLKIKEIMKLIVSKHKQCINLFPMFFCFFFFEQLTATLYLFKRHLILIWFDIYLKSVFAYLQYKIP